MGMYTGITFQAKVNKEYQKVFDVLYKANYGYCDDTNDFSYDGICTLFWYAFGGMVSLDRPYFLWYNDSYMTEEWCNSEYSNGYKDGIITVRTSIKNYQSQHEHFLELMSQVIDECYICEIIYEECVSPDVYEFIDGEFVIVKHSEYGY